MLKRLLLFVATGTLCCGPSFCQAKKLYTPAGDTLEKALKQSLLIQPGARPFHLKLIISATKGDTVPYASTLEETWISDSRWMRTVSAPGFLQTTVMNESGLHVKNAGDYFPLWLRNFETALFNPVPNASDWNRSKTPLEHMELPNGVKSSPCLHAEMIMGTPAARQVNFANVCFRPDGLLDFTGALGYAMEFHDYTGFGKLRVPRTLISNPARSVQLTGKIVALETADPAQTFETPADSAGKDTLESPEIKQSQLEKLAGGSIALDWPTPTPGHGMFTVWVSLDKRGTIREVQTLNSDESGFAADMAAQLQGKHWKSAVIKGEVSQVQGAIVFMYPPLSPEEAEKAAISLLQNEASGRKLSGPPPIYPPEAKRLQITGSVVMRARIGVDGSVTDISVVSSSSDLLSGAVLTAARQWKYEPYLLNGKPREVETDITINFAMNQ